MINEVIRFPNDIVVVFDEKGEQMPDYQGQYEDVRVKIMAHAPKSAEFFHGTLNVSSNAVSRKDW